MRLGEGITSVAYLMFYSLGCGGSLVFLIVLVGIKKAVSVAETCLRY